MISDAVDVISNRNKVMCKVSADISSAVNSLVAQADNLNGIQEALTCLERPELKFLAPLTPLFKHMASIPLLQENVKVLQSTVSKCFVEIQKNSEEIHSIREHLGDEAQWLRRPSLVFHGLPNVPVKKRGTSFSKYVAYQVNRLLPNLPERVTYKDIHASHPLGKAVLARFQRRDLKNEIYIQA